MEDLARAFIQGLGGPLAASSVPFSFAFVLLSAAAPVGEGAVNGFIGRAKYVFLTVFAGCVGFASIGLWRTVETVGATPTDLLLLRLMGAAVMAGWSVWYMLAARQREVRRGENENDWPAAVLASLCAGGAGALAWLPGTEPGLAEIQSLFGGTEAKTLVPWLLLVWFAGWITTLTLCGGTVALGLSFLLNPALGRLLAAALFILLVALVAGDLAGWISTRLFVHLPLLGQLG